MNVEFVKPLHPSKRKALATVQSSAKTPRTAVNEYTAIISEDNLYESILRWFPMPVYSPLSKSQCTLLTVPQLNLQAPRPCLQAPRPCLQAPRPSLQAP